MKHAIVDIDGCLCESIFKNLGNNDNDKLRNDEFERKLASVSPYEWAIAHDWFQYNKIIVITGRLTDHNHITRGWLSWLFSRSDFELYNTEWDDSLPTREDSYEDYVLKKADKILSEMVRLEEETGILHFDVFEDDEWIKSIVDVEHGVALSVYSCLIKEGEIQ